MGRSGGPEAIPGANAWGMGDNELVTEGRSDMRVWCLILIHLFLFCTVVATFAAEVDRDEAVAAARRWLAVVTAHQGDWAGDPAPRLLSIEPLREDGTLLGWHGRVAPDGWLVVSARRDLAPVKACGETGDGEGLAELIRDDLRDRVAAPSRSPHPAWARLLSAEPIDKSAAETVGPLLGTRWSQGWPYNTLCPEGDGGRTFVGCTALATAQLMRYHAWPPRGRGKIAYWWAGDTACGDGSPGDTLRADLEDTYDWDLMGDTVGADDAQESRDAVAELCYEVAAACLMDFSVCGSSAPLTRARAALVNDFRYGETAVERQRFRLSDEAWFDLIRADLDLGRPLLYASAIHTMVCDGWREIDGVPQIHVNYGWGGDSDGWFTLDALGTSLNPQAERLVGGLEPDLSTPVEIEAFTVERTADGAQLAWRVNGIEDVDGLHVRRAVGDEEAVRLTDAPLPIREWMSWTDPAPPTGSAEYWLEECLGLEGGVLYGPVTLAALARPAVCRLTAPNPNPCNPCTEARLMLERPGRVRAEILDARGRRVAVLLDASRPVGETVLRWDGRAADGRTAPSGVYLLRVRVDDSNQSRKVLLAR